MSSRLFQEVREKRGLVYSIGSYANQYAETGSMAVYAGAAPRRIHEVLKVVGDEVERLAADGLTPEELDRAKGQFKGSLVLGMEDTSSRMSWLGKSELTRGEILSVDQVIQRVDAVTEEDLRALAKELLGDGLSALALIGPFDADEFAEYVA
jgi:predicted Zn-dependent peptidase